MIIALASPGIAQSIQQGVQKVRMLIAAASTKNAEIICSPEAYVPGLRGLDFEVPPLNRTEHDNALLSICDYAREHSIATIIGMERPLETGRQILAYVIDARGEILGHQTKNQLDPSETANYVPGNTRRIFEINGVRFGISICHEGWRYPETVRWAAVRGAKIVFHPQITGRQNWCTPEEMGR